MNTENHDDTIGAEGVPDTSFVPHLDERQRAMLAEMGVRVWGTPPQAHVLPGAETGAAPARAALASRLGAPAPVVREASVVTRQPGTAVERAAPAPARSGPVAGAAALPTGIEQMDWLTLAEAVAQCRACGLCQGRTQSVLGGGSAQAQWMVVGEAPGEQEDLQGEPFVGPSGQLLDNMLRAIGLDRRAEGAMGTYITNAVKCRPPANRNPSPEEVAQCEPYLQRQIALLKPRIILAMGRFAVQTLLKTNEPIGRLRGRVHHCEGVPVIVTYHPAYLLRTPSDKAKAWADLCLAMDVAEQSAR